MEKSMIIGMGMCTLAVTAWGGMFPVMEHALKILDPFYFTTIRYGIVSLLFLLMLKGAEGQKSLSFEGKARSLWAFGTMGFAGFGFLVFWGQQKISGHEGVVVSAVIMATMPLLAALVTWGATGKRPPSVTLVSLAIAFVGVLLVITHGDLGLLHAMGSRLLADLTILAGGFCWVLYTWGGNRFPHWSPLRYTALSSAMGTLSLFGVTAIGTLTGKLHIPDGTQIRHVEWDLGYTILIAGILGVLSWNAGNRLLGTVNGVLFINLVPVVALGISSALGEPIRAGEILGSLLVITALVTNNLLQRPLIRSALSRMLAKKGSQDKELAGTED
jgi:drug/metabolite transporter (DMT)-like permease